MAAPSLTSSRPLRSAGWAAVLCSASLCASVSLPAAPRKSAVLLTGCSSGIGADAAARLVRCGFLVFATVRKESDMTALRQRCGNSNMIYPLILDVTKPEQIKAAVETVRQRMQQDGRQLMGVVNNAGYADQCPVELASVQLLRDQFEANVFGSVAVAQAFLPLLRQYTAASAASGSPSPHSARLLFVSSVGGRFSAAGAGPYCSSKAAVEALADAMRMELKHWRIDVSLIEPGAIGTDFFRTADLTTERRVAEARTALSNGAFPAGQSVLDFYAAADGKRMAETKQVPLESPSYASDAIECALLDSQPLARYNCGWTSLAVHLITHVPAELQDLALGRHFR